MAEKSKRPVPPFYQRFNIEVTPDEARQRFINRALNMIQGAIPDLETMYAHNEEHVRLPLILVASKLGVDYHWTKLFHDYAGTDFNSCLLALETLYQTYTNEYASEQYANKVDYSIRHAISLSETDLGIEWRDGTFWASGAEVLDEALVNENLKWLDDKDYQDVRAPFEKGLRHFLEAMQKPERLGDAVTDVYEAVEAIAKRVTGRDRDLSANAEMFINKLKLSDYYKKMLKDYIGYANDYGRHAAKLGEEKKVLKRNEVEAFIYTSGLFIRLAVQQM